MVEKVGHSKRMQVTRRAWLDDTKPYRKELTPPPELPVSETTAGGAASGHAVDDEPGADELDALMADAAGISMAERQASRVSGPFEEEPDEDELDALLADHETTTKPPLLPKPAHRMPFEDEPDDDELDALLAAETTSSARPSKTAATAEPQGDNDFADDEEAMRDMW